MKCVREAPSPRRIPASARTEAAAKTARAEMGYTYMVSHRLVLVFVLLGCSVDHAGLGPARGEDVGPALDAPADAPIIRDAGPDVFDAGMDSPPGVDAGPPLVLTSASYDVVAHGGRTTLSGENLSEITGATVGGVAVPIERLNAAGFRIRVPSGVPIGVQTLVATDGEREARYELTIVHLVVNEVDDETNSGRDTRQFIEVATYVKGALDLSGYILVVFDGDNDRSIYAVELGTTSSGGFFLIGNASGVDVVAPREFPLRNAMAVAIYQRQMFPDDMVATAESLIDAIVYRRSSTEPDENLSRTLLVPGGQNSVNEDVMGVPRRHSLHSTLRRGSPRQPGVARRRPHARGRQHVFIRRRSLDVLVQRA